MDTLTNPTPEQDSPINRDLASELEAISREAQPKTESKLSREDFRDHAEDVLSTLTTYAKAKNLTREQAVAVAEAEYGEGAEDIDPALKELTGVLISIPDAYEADKRINEARSIGRLSHEQMLALNNDVTIACSFNRALVGLAHENPDTFRLADVRHWLTTGSDAKTQWAKNTSTGIAGEVAIAKAVAEDPRVKEIVLPTVEEDKRGIDFHAICHDGRDITVDAKVGRARQVTGVSYNRGNLEIGINTDDIDDSLKITKRALPYVQRDIDAMFQ